MILYVVRLAARFDNYVSFLLQAAISRLYLAYISLHLPYVSFLLQAAISRLYLAYISPISHHISPT